MTPSLPKNASAYGNHEVYCQCTKSQSHGVHEGKRDTAVIIVAVIFLITLAVTNYQCTDSVTSTLQLYAPGLTKAIEIPFRENARATLLPQYTPTKNNNT